jgi:magnesium transporter
MSEEMGSARPVEGAYPRILEYVGEHPVDRAHITYYTYGVEGVTVQPVEAVSPEGLEADRVHWVNVTGLSDVPAILRVSALVGLHPLAVEDILNSSQHPKMEDTSEYLYLVLKAPDLQEDTRHVTLEQVAVVLGRNIVLSFQERSPDLFQPLIERLTRNHIPLREAKADFLAYALVDTIVDQYFDVLEAAGERLEEVEDLVLAGRSAEENIQVIHALRRELIVLRRSVWPLREVLSALLRDGSPLIREGTMMYLRDVYDHTIQVMDTLETYRETLSSLFDIHLSSISNRMNQIMKVLTLAATVFIPLTFIVGVYGMNFRYMPELYWRWSYPILWLIMIGIAGAMLYYFRRKGWF